MKLCHSIGPKISRNHNTLDEILACKEPISFDGVYRSVWDNRHALRGMDITMFFMGEYIGSSNAFDNPVKVEYYCTFDELLTLRDTFGFKLGFHTWTHRDLTKIDNYEEIIEEITPPMPCESLAYPYGNFDKTVLDAVREVGYKYAYTVYQGDGSPHQLLRTYL